MTRSLVAARLISRCLFGLVLLALPTTACSGDVQGGSAQTAASAADGNRGRFDPKTFPLDEAGVRKLAAVMRAWDPKGPEPKTQDPNVYVDPMARIKKGIAFENKVVGEFMSQNSTATIESVPELKAAIAREGLSPREFATLFVAYKSAEGQLMVTGLTQLAGAVSGTAPPKAPQPAPNSSGVFENNLELLRRMDKERTLPPSGWGAPRRPREAKPSAPAAAQPPLPDGERKRAALPSAKREAPTAAVRSTAARCLSAADTSPGCRNAPTHGWSPASAPAASAAAWD